MSSYEKNNFGQLLRAIVIATKPVCLVELGIGYGYSTKYIAQGVMINKERFGLNGHLDSYDIFEDYPYKHGVKKDVETLLEKEKLNEFATICKGDAFKAHEKYNNKQINFLHVDLSNTGEIIRKIMELWDKKIVQGGYIIFEGGSEERDKVEWMIKYKKESIRKEIESNAHIGKNYVYGTYHDFPSMTVLLKKFDNE